MTRLALALIRLYKNTVSRVLPPACRFQPTCSSYAAEAIQRHGFARGSWLALKRIVRCHPFSKGGYDPVPEHRMKQPKTLLVAVIAVFALLVVSCIPGAGQPMGGWSGPAVRDGVIYVGSRDGRLVAINSSTQSRIWEHTFTSLIYTTPIVHGDLVYVGTYGGHVYALTVARGAEDWVYPRRGSIGAIVGGLVVANETIYVSSSDGRVYALDAARGHRKWKSKPLADKLWTSPAVMGNTLYVSTFDGYIYALSIETGDLLDWSFRAPAGFASSPVIHENTIYVGSFDRHLYAIEIGSNTSKWRFPRDKPAGNWFWASPIVSEGIVYAGCLDGTLYAINATTGDKLWEFPAGSPIVSSPVLINNLLIIAAESGNVFIVNPQTGAGERIRNPDDGEKPTINARIRASIYAHEGFVYVRGEDNRLYAVDIDKREVSWVFALTIEE